MKSGLGKHVKFMERIEELKLTTFVKETDEILSANKNNKMILALNYKTKTISVLRDLLEKYNPLILTGDITNHMKRAEIIDKFNDDPNYRLLILTTTVGREGISLHDTDGKYPRYMLISPSYRAIDISQCASRIHRDGCKSDATVRIFYGKGDGLSETKILDAMARKSDVIKGTLDSVARETILLPGDYEAVYY